MSRRKHIIGPVSEKVAEQFHEAIKESELKFKIKSKFRTKSDAFSFFYKNSFNSKHR